ncbi:hypothetical protein DAPPUDRAFT_237265 [Daphnia pulex]|uniref:Uncharacterized protein n=1 Tax=Daphnia pulex TaxID=6669 RepID=E9G3H8_DAPPU|nr:hypothetical protein DAPPUDRAFT_237265 [Daphnia pulex]|eukprot:EFX85986.1 hypothetical protein DAPPUDRAFT_237265 [Daphnia pulex]
MRTCGSSTGHRSSVHLKAGFPTYPNNENVLLDEPLFNGVTSITVTAETSTLTKATPCFITSTPVSQCRRKRGIVERPKMIQGDNWEITPSAVIRVKPTDTPILPRSKFQLADRIVSSFDDSYSSTLNIFRQLEARGRNNIITVGNCGMSTVNFSEFLSCLGMTVQETTTLTATFTETTTLSTGYTTMTVLGCTPAGFPYIYCPTIVTYTPIYETTTGTYTTTTDEVVIWEETNTWTTEGPLPNYPQYFFTKY